MEQICHQDLKKESPELILDAKKASAKKRLQKSQEEVSDPAREPGLGAPNPPPCLQAPGAFL